jgi:prepilin-type N-terminal cleavage/methylation domain-containing protein
MFYKSIDMAKGHTLLEILVVLGIVSILAVMAIPIFDHFTESSKVDELKAYILKASAAQEKYFASKGEFSPTVEGLADFGFPTVPNDKMELSTGVIIRQNLGVTYWVSGNYDIDPEKVTTYNECWLYFGSVMGTGESDNFLQMHNEIKDSSIASGSCALCPTLDLVCK